ncbi:MAG: hypothetical protein GY861_07415 [bacterium]|nr:hypothetical protein [bacterium]
MKKRALILLTVTLFVMLLLVNGAFGDCEEHGLDCDKNLQKITHCSDDYKCEESYDDNNPNEGDGKCVFDEPKDDEGTCYYELDSDDLCTSASYTNSLEDGIDDIFCIINNYHGMNIQSCERQEFCDEEEGDIPYWAPQKKDHEGESIVYQKKIIEIEDINRIGEIEAKTIFDDRGWVCINTNPDHFDEEYRCTEDGVLGGIEGYYFIEGLNVKKEDEPRWISLMDEKTGFSPYFKSEQNELIMVGVDTESGEREARITWDDIDGCDWRHIPVERGETARDGECIKIEMREDCSVLMCPYCHDDSDGSGCQYEVEGTPTDNGGTGETEWRADDAISHNGGCDNNGDVYFEGVWTRKNTADNKYIENDNDHLHVDVEIHQEDALHKIDVGVTLEVMDPETCRIDGVKADTFRIPDADAGDTLPIDVNLDYCGDGDLDDKNDWETAENCPQDYCAEQTPPCPAECAEGEADTCFYVEKPSVFFSGGVYHIDYIRIPFAPLPVPVPRPIYYMMPGATLDVRCSDPYGETCDDASYRIMEVDAAETDCPIDYDSYPEVPSISITEGHDGVKVCAAAIDSEGTPGFSVPTKLVIGEMPGTNKIALKMLNYVDAADDYSLYCGPANEVLNNDDDTEGLGNFCVLNVNQGEQVLVGSSVIIDEESEDPQQEVSDFFGTLGDDVVCGEYENMDEDGDFHACDGKQLWIDRKGQSFIYSNKEIELSQGFVDTILTFLENLFSFGDDPDADFIESVKSSIGASQLYVFKQGEEYKILGSKEAVPVEGDSAQELMFLEYHGFTKNMCTGAGFDNTICENSEGVYYVTASKSTQLSRWKDLTAKIRINEDFDDTLVEDDPSSTTPPNPVTPPNPITQPNPSTPVTPPPVSTPLEPLVLEDCSVPADAEVFEIELETGWNYVSIPLAPRDTDVEEIFTCGEGEIEIVWYLDPDESWVEYSSSVNNIGTLDAGQPFIVNVPEGTAKLKIISTEEPPASSVYPENIEGVGFIIGVKGKDAISFDSVILGYLDIKDETEWERICLLEESLDEGGRTCYGKTGFDDPKFEPGNAYRILPPVTYELSLKSGLNFVSIPLEPRDNSVEEIFSSIPAGELNSVSAFDTSTGGWNFYYPNTPNPKLKTLDAGEPFYINVNNDQTVVIEGTEPDGGINIVNLRLLTGSSVNENIIGVKGTSRLSGTGEGIGAKRLPDICPSTVFSKPDLAMCRHPSWVVSYGLLYPGKAYWMVDRDIREPAPPEPESKPAEFTFVLQRDFNLVSMPIEPDDARAFAIFGDIPEVDSVYKNYDDELTYQYFPSSGSRDEQTLELHKGDIFIVRVEHAVSDPFEVTVTGTEAGQETKCSSHKFSATGAEEEYCGITGTDDATIETISPSYNFCVKECLSNFCTDISQFKGSCYTDLTDELIPGKVYQRTARPPEPTPPEPEPTPPEPTPEPVTPPVSGDPGSAQTFTFNLNKGWNIASMPIEPTNPRATAIFGDFHEEIDAVWVSKQHADSGHYTEITYSGFPPYGSGAETFEDQTMELHVGDVFLIRVDMNYDNDIFSFDVEGTEPEEHIMKINHQKTFQYPGETVDYYGLSGSEPFPFDTPGFTVCTRKCPDEDGCDNPNDVEENRVCYPDAQMFEEGEYYMPGMAYTKEIIA